eukprot:TRINITY_DN4170_c0_g2_i1.p1 TRINITY_DN4170_c0_g2~~TRINITY_DN4170_c0_g2_i1.p1  ORF type:complete len:893 (-),score=176.68 TRINITY_DN4170_c0_g2_i1:18-2588(-)
MRISSEASVTEKTDDSSLMVTFWKHCFDADHLVLEKIRLFEQIYDCTQHKTMNDGYQFYQVEDHYIAFFDVVHQHCLDAEGLDFDHDYHCVDHIQYEPIFKLHGGAFGNGYSTQETAECNQDVSSVFSFDKFTDGAVDGAFNFVTYSSDNGVDVYVLDSGVYAEHNNFLPGQVVHMLGDGPAIVLQESGLEYNSHGTHVAGTIGGLNTGLLKGVPIYDYRVCEFYSKDYGPACYTSLLISAFQGIYDRMNIDTTGRRGVINLSIGGGAPDIVYNYFFELLKGLGAIPVTSAGNAGADACLYTPSRLSSCITVGALDINQTSVASFSNYGPCVDIYAPGTNVLSSVTGTTDHCSCYQNYHGTSMASPHVSGFVAGLLYINPSISIEQILYRIVNTSYEVSEYSSGSCDDSTCFGFIGGCDKVESDSGSVSRQELHPSFYYNPDYNFNINAYKHQNSENCNVLAFIYWKLYEDDGKLYDLKYYTDIIPTNMCIGNKEETHLEPYSILYACNFDSNGTITRYTYHGDSCDGNPETIEVIYPGYFDGSNIYHPYCGYTKEEESLNCGMKLRFFPGEYTSNCPEDRSNYTYYDSYLVRGHCMFTRGYIYDCTSDSSYGYSSDFTDCSTFSNSYTFSFEGCYYTGEEYSFFDFTCFPNHPCEDVDCNGNGECSYTDKKSKGQCGCYEFYGGDNCEINTICDEVHCNYRGSCIANGTTYTCECLDNYTGNDCEIDQCENIDCNANGNCLRINEPPYYLCDCVIGDPESNCYVAQTTDMNPIDDSSSTLNSNSNTLDKDVTTFDTQQTSSYKENSNIDTNDVQHISSYGGNSEVSETGTVVINTVSGCGFVNFMIVYIIFLVVV